MSGPGSGTPGRHRPIVRPLIESALEGGLSHSDAVHLAIAVYKEIDLLARGPSLNILPPSTMREIRAYARAILRSGSTFSAFEIAQRAVATHRLAQDEIRKLDMQWRTETVGKRLRRVREREERTRQATGAGVAKRTSATADGDGEVVLDSRSAYAYKENMMRRTETPILDLDPESGWLDHDSLGRNLDAGDLIGANVKPWEIEE